MTGAGWVLAINLFVAALFALAFLLVAITNRADRVAPWFSAAYVFGMLYLVCEFALPFQQHPQLTYVAGFAAFLGAVSAIVMGVAKRYRRPPPVRFLLAFGALAVLANWLAFDLGRESILRMFAYQAPYAITQALAAFIVLRSGRRQPMDMGLGALFAFSAIQFMAKPLLAHLLGGPGASPQTYIFSNYALVSQSLSAILQVGVGLVMLMVLFRDMLLDVTARSETDFLSGLLNRRGFEDRAQAQLAAARPDYPTSLVLADLDSFKAVNDEFGHEVGDTVIRAFSDLAASKVPATASVARLGGEEFAILLPGTPAATARLFCESLRTGFATLPLPELPAGRFCTVSMGIAETIGQMTLPDLRRRADAALYEAKRAGRDRVHMAAANGNDTMPSHPMPKDLSGAKAVSSGRVA